MEQVNQKISSAHNWLARTAFVFFAIMLIAFFGIVYVSNKQYETPTSVTPTPNLYTAPSTTSDQTANWKTYINTSFYYSVKIPTNWEAFRQTGDDTIISMRQVGLEEIPITINAQVNKKSVSVNEWVSSQYGVSYPRETKILYGKTWVIVNSNISPYSSRSYFTSHKDKVYQLGVSTLKEDSVAIFETILSTFNILDDQITQIIPEEKQQIDAWILKKISINMVIQKIRSTPAALRFLMK